MLGRSLAHRPTRTFQRRMRRRPCTAPRFATPKKGRHIRRVGVLRPSLTLRLCTFRCARRQEFSAESSIARRIPEAYTRQAEPAGNRPTEADAAEVAGNLEDTAQLRAGQENARASSTCGRKIPWRSRSCKRSLEHTDTFCGDGTLPVDAQLRDAFYREMQNAILGRTDARRALGEAERSIVC